MFNHLDERNKTGSKLRIGVVSGSYGCPNCGSKDIEEIGNNHHQTKDEMEYLEYCRCLKCKHEFVE
jgi:predicted RNA-binding Zn-ribbon protein involved in translation (DUF1610 family)